jgi:hypothetical protein
VNTHSLAKGIIYNNGIWKKDSLGGSWIRQEKIGVNLEKKHNEELRNTFHTQLLG